MILKLGYALRGNPSNVGTILLFSPVAEQVGHPKCTVNLWQGHGGFVLQRTSQLDPKPSDCCKCPTQVNNGFLEGIVRGYKAGILNQGHYASLTQCESLEGALPKIPLY